MSKELFQCDTCRRTFVLRIDPELDSSLVPDGISCQYAIGVPEVYGSMPLCGGKLSRATPSVKLCAHCRGHGCEKCNGTGAGRPVDECCAQSLEAALKEAAPVMDWQQVVLNGGPPCFALTGELWIDGRRRYCGRAERWHEHGDHPFVGLDDLIAPPAPVTTEAPAQPEVAKTRLTELTYVATTDDGLREIKAWANSRLRADLSLEASVEEPERYARIEDLTNRLSAACAAWNSALRAKNDLAPAAQQLATLRTAAEAIAACETCQRVGFQWDGPGMCEKHAATVATALRDVLAKIGGAKN